MDVILFLLFFTFLSVLLDVYFFQILKNVIKLNTHFSKYILFFYWFFTFITIANFLLFAFDISIGYYPRTIVFNIIIGNFFCKLISLPFILVDDLRRLICYFLKSENNKDSGSKISRSKFLSISASIAYGFPVASLMYGIISSNVYDYRIRRKNLIFNKLPKSFDGIKICQISDIHIGSLNNTKAVIGGIDMIINEKPDIIFFTGDLVNDKSSELKNWGDILSKIKAPLGVHSVLGNHDYGEYTSWSNKNEKNNNFQNLLSAQKEFGWNLMMNENKSITVDRDKISILGVENWASSRFQKYGDLDKAYSGLSQEEFKILLTHNPSHWNAQVTSLYNDIDLTLSGHTHGLQFGIEIGNFRISPARLAYDQWADLYQLNNQSIYVNRGFGFLGYQGRVGILPEITILNLEST
ncbi:MAG: metallophosphoesterase [Bacteroidota bacterium]|nr:metallophosphoesterase [Bacteroidota bacterium]